MSSVYQQLVGNGANSRKAKLAATANERTHLLKAEQALFRSLRTTNHDNGGGAREDGELQDATDNMGITAEQEVSSRTLGTFEGVFAPVSLSMLSSILFLRVGYIVGNAGYIETLLQYGIAYSILTATVLSICAIATNGAVEGGGVYFMISRTLGMEFGGAIGILFWMGNVVSSALYLAACTEGLVGSFGLDIGSLSQVLPSSKWWMFLYSSVVNTINMVVCIVGSKLFGRASTLVLMVVCICTLVTMGSFFTNNVYVQEFVYNATMDCIPPTDNTSLPNCTKVTNGTFTGLAASSKEIIMNNFLANLDPEFSFDCSDPMEKVDFFIVFGVMFSGVTGIMSGANLSGDLVSPGKNIPMGTLSACFFTFNIFVIMATLTAMTCSPEFILHDCMYLTDFSLWKPIVTIGVFLATFSASLNNLIGASRVLQAVAKDVMFGPILVFITKGTIKDNPIAAILVAWFFVQLFLLMGSLNSIAQLSSVLFLLSYAAVNLACLGLDLASAPNFRPSFKYFSWHTSLFGLIGTATMMFFVSPLFSTVSVLMCLSLVFALNFLSPIQKQNYGSISQALLFHQVRKYLLLLDPRKAHVKFWRPQILLLVSNPRTSCSLIDFVNALKKGGLYVIGHVYKDDLSELERDPCAIYHHSWLSLVDHLRVKAFVELTLASSLREGIQHLMRLSGIGAMKPNTIVLGFLDETFTSDDFQNPYSSFSTDKFEEIFPHIPQTFLRDNEDGCNNSLKFTIDEYVGTLRDILKMQKNVCISRHFQHLDKGTLFRTDQDSFFSAKTRKKCYLDVWLVDFFSSKETDISDTTSLFLLQLACIGKK